MRVRTICKILTLTSALGLCACGKQMSAMMCSSVPLSPEVKAFIDRSLANPGAGQVAALTRQVTELEAKVAELQKLNATVQSAVQTAKELRQRNCAAAEASVQSLDMKLKVARGKEVQRLRGEILQSCMESGLDKQTGAKRR